MPAINVEIGPLPIEQKRQLVRELTEAAANITGAPKQAFYVFINEYPYENVAVGGELMSDRRA